MSSTLHAPKSSRKERTVSPVRTIALWLVLIGMCVALAGTEDSPKSEAPWLRLGLYLFPFVLLGLTVVIAAVHARRARKLNRLMEPAMSAAANDDYGRAEAIYRNLCFRFTEPPQVASVPRYNLADALMRQGKLREAIEELSPVAYHGGTSGISSRIAIKLATLFALTGSVDLADEWLETAARRVENDVARVTNGSPLVVARALLACRREQFEAALELLETNWNRLEGTLSSASMREARLLRGYATLKTSGPREAGAAYRWLGPEERGPRLAYMASEWPELRVTTAPL